MEIFVVPCRVAHVLYDHKTNEIRRSEYAYFLSNGSTAPVGLGV
jgi:hypothetical protein